MNGVSRRESPFNRRFASICGVKSADALTLTFEPFDQIKYTHAYANSKLISTVKSNIQSLKSLLEH